MSGSDGSAESCSCNHASGRKNTRRGIPALPFCHLKLKAQKPIHGYPKNIKTIGDHIRKKRLDLGLYQKDVAKIIGVSEATIYNWENRRTLEPPVSVYPKIFMFLGYVPYDSMMPFCERLVVWRKSLGLTQREFARQVGLDTGTILRWEKRKTKPGRKAVEKIKIS